MIQLLKNQEFNLKNQSLSDPNRKRSHYLIIAKRRSERQENKKLHSGKAITGMKPSHGSSEINAFEIRIMNSTLTNDTSGKCKERCA